MLRHTGSDSDPRQRAALADCVQLMDLARDRLADASPAVAAAAADDARTWLSAALTYYATCTDGVVVDGPLRDAVVARLEPLKSLASASLAVLSAVVDDSGSRDAGLADTTYTFPSWVPARDRALLEAGAAIEADVVVAQDGSGKFRTVKEAVDAAPDGGKSRYVIYVKKGVYKENVEVGKKKRELMIVGDGMDATVITGSRNVVDGATTFNSATLGDAPRQCPVSPLRFQYSHSFPALYAANIRLSSDFAFTFGSLTIP
jgi:pectinesterase